MIWGYPYFWKHPYKLGSTWTINFFLVFFLGTCESATGEVGMLWKMLIGSKVWSWQNLSTGIGDGNCYGFFWIKAVFLVFLVIKSRQFIWFLWWFSVNFLWMPKKMTLRRVLDVAVSLLIAMNVAVAGLQHKAILGTHRSKHGSYISPMFNVKIMFLCGWSTSIFFFFQDAYTSLGLRSWCCRINRWDMMQLESLANMIRAWTACPSLRIEVWADWKLLFWPKKDSAVWNKDFFGGKVHGIHWQVYPCCEKLPPQRQDCLITFASFLSQLTNATTWSRQLCWINPSPLSSGDISKHRAGHVPTVRMLHVAWWALITDAIIQTLGCQPGF